MKYISIGGSIAGIISSPLLIALAIYGYDYHGPEHSFTTLWFFVLFAIAIMIYSIAINLNKNYPKYKIAAIISLLFSILNILFIVRVFSIINVIMQKIIVYGFISWTIFQVILIWKEIGS